MKLIPNSRKSLPRLAPALLMVALLASLVSLPAWSAGFQFKDTAGVTHTLRTYAGKWVVVNFWATWCAPCLAEMPDFEAEWQARHGRDLVVIGVAMDWDQAEEVTKFAAQRGVHYPIVLGNDDLAAQLGEVSGLPVTFVFDPKGHLVDTTRGKLDRAHLQQLTGAAAH